MNKPILAPYCKRRHFFSFIAEFATYAKERAPKETATLKRATDWNFEPATEPRRKIATCDLAKSMNWWLFFAGFGAAFGVFFGTVWWLFLLHFWGGI